jgi:hypothetical protein
MLGFRASVGLTEGLRETVAWHQERRGALAPAEGAYVA